jgi:hypothetical protein
VTDNSGRDKNCYGMTVGAMVWELLMEALFINEMIDSLYSWRCMLMYIIYYLGHFE